MIVFFHFQEHKFVSGKSKGLPKVDSSLPSVNNSVSNVLVPGNAPMMTLTDDGGIQVEWRPYEISEQDTTEATTGDTEPPVVKDKDPEKPASALEKQQETFPKGEVQKVKQRARKIKYASWQKN